MDRMRYAVKPNDKIYVIGVDFGPKGLKVIHRGELDPNYQIWRSFGHTSWIAQGQTGYHNGVYYVVHCYPKPGESQAESGLAICLREELILRENSKKVLDDLIQFVNKISTDAGRKLYIKEKLSQGSYELDENLLRSIHENDPEYHPGIDDLDLKLMETSNYILDSQIKSYLKEQEIKNAPPPTPKQNRVKELNNMLYQDLVELVLKLEGW